MISTFYYHRIQSYAYPMLCIFLELELASCLVIVFIRGIWKCFYGAKVTT